MPARRSRYRRPVERPWWLAADHGFPRTSFMPGDPVRGYQSKAFADFAIVGEGPGADEAQYGYPMIGATGQEVDRHLRRVGLSRADALVTNVTSTLPVKKGVLGRPNSMLLRELADAAPIVFALGRHAARHFLGDVSLESIHGIPVQAGDRIILPGYHPAAGMHQVELAAHVQQDFDALAALLRGELDVRSSVLDDPFPDPFYHEMTDKVGPFRYGWGDWLGIDTEGSESKPWGLSFSATPGTAYVIRASAPRQLAAFREGVIFHAKINPNFRVALHNSMHDLPILRRLGIDLIALDIPFIDTMIVAYQLCTEPQGLKALCIRWAAMHQQDYSDLVGPYTWNNAMGYLGLVAFGPQIPARDRYIEFVVKGGELLAKEKKPTPIHKRALKILQDVEADKRNKDDEPPDPYKRWYQIEDEDRLAAEERYGQLHEASLDDVPDADAIYYSARDADATRRIAPALVERHRAIYGAAA